MAIKHLKKEEDGERLWRVLHGKQKEHELLKGDRIRVGSSEFDVYSLSKEYKLVSKTKIGDYKPEGYTCRYCMEGESSESDPLISICKCSGSVKYLHLSCLREWLMSNCQKDEQ